MRHVAVKFAICIAFILTVVPAVTAFNNPGPVGFAAMEGLDHLPYLWTGVQVHSASSYDRTDNNIDRNSFLYSVGSEKVMMDVIGSGCIYRIWVTGEGVTDQTIRIYIDGETANVGQANPSITYPCWRLFYHPTVMNGPAFPQNVNTNPPFPFQDPFAAYSSGGYYCYIPFQFRERCIVTISDPGADWFYYNIAYHTYTDPNAVTPYAGYTQAQIDPAKAFWQTNDDPYTASANAGSTTVAPGATYKIPAITGERVITCLAIRIPQVIKNDPASDEILDKVKIRICWDDEGTPSVDAPIGEFFGTGLGENTVKSLPLRMGTQAGDWYRCYFHMPFGSKAQIEIENKSSSVLNPIEWDIISSPLPNAAVMLAQGKIGYFHAKYNRMNTVTDVDYPLFQSSGRGCLVGIQVTMRAAEQRFKFLEGDERIHIDGSYTPSIYGTGTEDIFNCGFYYDEGEVSVQTHGAPAIRTSGNYMVSSYRMYIPDTIPYYSSIRYGLEHGDINDRQGDYSSIAYYYEVDNPGLCITDELDIGNKASEDAHGYSCQTRAWSGVTSMRYEGDDPAIISDDGYKVTGYSQFTVAIDPANTGVKLRRRLSYNTDVANQSAVVYVDDSSAPVGTWYDPGCAPDRWRDSDFEIPAAYTSGKDHIKVKLVTSNWTEYRYQAYSYVDSDSKAPAPPSGFTALGLVGQNHLVWKNPADPDLKGLLVVYKTDGYPASPSDGTVVCDNIAWPESLGSSVHSSLTDGVTYYYAAYAYDSNRRFSAPAYACSTPGEVSCLDAKQLPEGTSVVLRNRVVTGMFPQDGFFYVEEPDRTSGIRVYGPTASLSIGALVDVTGYAGTVRSVNGPAQERCISNATVSNIRSGTPLKPLGMNCRAVGGGGILPYIVGVNEGVGTNNCGLLARISGKVTAISSGSPAHIFVDDGSNVQSQNDLTGVMVRYTSSNVPVAVGDIVSVTGIIAGYVPENWLSSCRYMLVRQPNDLVVIKSDSGLISGVVREPSGKVVPRAVVSASPGGHSTVADDNGSYVFRVPAGTYTLTGTKGGYSSQVLNNKVVSEGQTTTADFTIYITGTERCANRDFESGSFSFWGGTIGNNWGAAFTNNAKNASWAAVSFGGSMTERVTITNTSTNAGISSGATGLAPGTRFRWSGYCYQTQPNYTVWLSALDVALPQAALPGPGVAFPPGINQWKYQEIEGVINNSWAITTYAGIDYIASPSGDVYFDNFSLLVW